MINPKELLFVVDEDNNPVKSLSRSQVHNQGLWHRVAYVWVVNSDGLILCQLRSFLKDNSPGKLEPFFGGHMEPGADEVDVAIRELEEEIGVKASAAELYKYGLYKSVKEKEFQNVFVYFWSGKLTDLKLEEDEVESVDLYEIDELKEIFTRDDEDWILQGNEADILDFIKSKMSAGRES